MIYYRQNQVHDIHFGTKPLAFPPWRHRWAYLTYLALWAALSWVAFCTGFELTNHSITARICFLAFLENKICKEIHHSVKKIVKGGLPMLNIESSIPRFRHFDFISLLHRATEFLNLALKPMGFFFLLGDWWFLGTLKMHWGIFYDHKRQQT